MLSNISMTGAGVVLGLLTVGLPIFGVHVDNTQLGDMVNKAFEVLSFILMIAGQLRRPDLHFGLIRKG